MSETMVTWAILLAIPEILASWQMFKGDREAIDKTDFLFGNFLILVFTGVWIGFFCVVIWMIHSAHWRF